MYKSCSGAVINENGSPVGVGSTTSDDMLTLAVRVEGQENRVKVRSFENKEHSRVRMINRPLGLDWDFQSL